MSGKCAFGVGCLLVAVVLLAPTRVRGDLYFDDGRTHIVDYTIADGVIVTGTTDLIVNAGGSIDGVLLQDTSRLIMNAGGSVGEIGIGESSYGAGPQVFINGGSVGALSFFLDRGPGPGWNFGRATIRGGVIGAVEFDQRTWDIGLDIYGGQILNPNLNLDDGGFTVIHGTNFSGEVWDNPNRLSWEPGTLDLYSRVVPRVNTPNQYWVASDYALVRGELASGEPFEWRFNTYDGQLFLHIVPVPGALLLGGLGLSFSGWLLRRHRRR